MSPEELKRRREMRTAAEKIRREDERREKRRRRVERLFNKKNYGGPEITYQMWIAAKRGK